MGAGPRTAVVICPATDGESGPAPNLTFPHHEDRMPTHGYAESREAAMAAFAKSWRRE